MPISLTIDVDDVDELAMTLRGLLREISGGGNVVALPEARVKEVATQAAVAQGAATTNTPSRMTVEDLKAGMTLKETQTATLGDGTRAAPGDNVMFKGEEWVVYHTYRGRLIAATEDNKADILPAEECTAVVAGDTTPSKPRPGTAGALLSQPDPNQRPADQAKAIGAPTDGPIDPAFAAKLRDDATDAVSSEKVSVDAVFAKLNELGGASSIDQLTQNTAKAFADWLFAQTQPKAMGF
jgi:hypothetical protein